DHPGLMGCAPLQLASRCSWRSPLPQAAGRRRPRPGACPIIIWRQILGSTRTLRPATRAPPRFLIRCWAPVRQTPRTGIRDERSGGYRSERSLHRGHPTSGRRRTDPARPAACCETNGPAILGGILASAPAYKSQRPYIALLQAYAGFLAPFGTIDAKLLGKTRVDRTAPDGRTHHIFGVKTWNRRHVPALVNTGRHGDIVLRNQVSGVRIPLGAPICPVFAPNLRVGATHSLMALAPFWHIELHLIPSGACALASRWRPSDGFLG